MTWIIKGFGLGFGGLLGVAAALLLIFNLLLLLDWMKTHPNRR